jgi:choice-of-anchor B domain-containing protein
MKSAFFFLFFLPSIGICQEQKNITFLDNWHQDSLLTNSSNVRYSGCWGFVKDDKEYAAIGSTEGTHFFLLDEQNKFQPCGFIAGRFSSSQVIHREIKTYKNFAYLICDEGSSSLQIVDLSYLPDSVVKVADIQDENFGKVHNLFIDTTHALLYACLVTPIVNNIASSIIPLRVFSLENPLEPELKWQGPSDIPEVHDIYVRNNIAILNCGQNGLRVYDFNLPNSPIYKSNLTFYQDQGYNHQGWLTPDGKTYVFADETNGKRVKKCKVDSDFNISIQSYFGTNHLNNSVPHNIMCSNEFAYIAYYNEGLRIYDIRNFPVEIASYDTYPQESSFKMNGAWGVYSNYPSNRIIVSDRQNGLFLFHFDPLPFLAPSTQEFNVYPNPIGANQQLTIRSKEDKITDFEVILYTKLGIKLWQIAVKNKSLYTIERQLKAGSYTLEIRYKNHLGKAIKETRKVIYAE